MAGPYFSQKTFRFLQDLAGNNNRDWFNQHKTDYEMQVREPALALITDMQEQLPGLSSSFLAVPKKVGGSLMRVYRDTRFGKDKTPYKTNIGIQFRHEAGKDVHAPGYYLHIANDGCFLGVGIWRPDSDALGLIREGIDENRKQWHKARNHKAFAQEFTLEGESLKRPPRGYSSEHPYLDDIKRKDFIAISKLNKKIVLSANLLPDIVKRFKKATPFMKFLCQSLELRFE